MVAYSRRDGISITFKIKLQKTAASVLSTLYWIICLGGSQLSGCEDKQVVNEEGPRDEEKKPLANIK